MIEFPKDFFWGSATSAYQLEGNNQNSDWWHWEKQVGLREKSGLACRHYELFKDDFDLAKELNQNALRISIEWARIQPQKGQFSKEEINHYIEVLLALKSRNLEPIVTLHHFTNPLWISQLGGWENKDTIKHFLNYVRHIVEILATSVKFWVTINEPEVYTYHSFAIGAWPPQKKSLIKAHQVTVNLSQAHIQAYRLIHKIYQERRLQSPLVSIAKNMQLFLPYKNKLRNQLVTFLRNRYYNYSFLDNLWRKNCLDFIGLNYYTRQVVDLRGWRLRNFVSDTCRENFDQVKKNSLGWDIYPKGIYQLLVGLKKYKLPVFILENGICTEDDNLRWEYIQEHLKNIALAMQQGAKVLGYLYWSLMDNFEWDKGFSPRFGLIEIDYESFGRKIRESAKKYANVCKTGKVG